MRFVHLTTLVLAVAILLGICIAADAASPAATPVTLWNFLGIPQGVNKIRDATINRRGNRPGLERKDPLKRIADPANLESDNPAIKKAAEIKKEEDLAPQKVKAIKYLAEVKCCCYPGVSEALLAALSDCTEAVRYEAAIAFCRAAGNPCSDCNGCSCCNAKVMNKLSDMAFGQDENGCCKEPSMRVRLAARNALMACRRVQRPTPATETPVEEPKELPVQPVPTPATNAESWQSPGMETGESWIEEQRPSEDAGPAFVPDSQSKTKVHPASFSEVAEPRSVASPERAATTAIRRPGSVPDSCGRHARLVMPDSSSVPYVIPEPSGSLR